MPPLRYIVPLRRQSYEKDFIRKRYCQLFCKKLGDIEKDNRNQKHSHHFSLGLFKVLNGNVSLVYFHFKPTCLHKIT